MLSDISYLVLFICTFTLQTLANSDVSESESERARTSTKSGEMPASIVFLLLFIFTSLGFICIRHIRREYNQQQTYLKAKQSGTMLNDSIGSKGYGSIFGPNLNSNTIDQYIDDSLYGNYAIIDRINHYRRSIQQRIVDYMEQTPEPVTFEVNADKTVGPYCKNTRHQTSNTSKSESKPIPIQHSKNYDPTLSPALQSIFNANYKKSNKQKTAEIIKEDNNEQKEAVAVTKNVNNNDHKINIKNRINCDDFNDYDDNDNDNDNDNDDYDVIPENHAYSDSDNNLSDSDNGQNIKKNDQPLLTKVVVLDLD